ncbi:hypothetical protein E4U43_001706 [Claviceps pusilla]|uniref:Uncharacterized protein n=1 Tax=Claviceps pusilla TaxID=123648 RepID=A0A9P7NG66_9HYPO|nr:hypothetical protein E4U43_001706 [Claviceps pusilla]
MYRTVELFETKTLRVVVTEGQRIRPIICSHPVDGAGKGHQDPGEGKNTAGSSYLRVSRMWHVRWNHQLALRSQHFPILLHAIHFELALELRPNLDPDQLEFLVKVCQKSSRWPILLLLLSNHRPGQELLRADFNMAVPDRQWPINDVSTL